MKKVFIHVSEVDITSTSGMGRVEFYWKHAFERRGNVFIHIGPLEVGKMVHPGSFPYKAYKYFKSLDITPDAIIVHEPAASPFLKTDIPCFIESHGVERRLWEGLLQGVFLSSHSISLKTRILFPLWRLRSCDAGLKRAKKLLLINKEDASFVQAKYNRTADDIFIFRNGINQMQGIEKNNRRDKFTIVFNGSWIDRKGIKTLVSAANLLHQKGIYANYLLIGTGKDSDVVLNDWPEVLHPCVQVINKFAPDEEKQILLSASLFVLPSYFEGQPLSLLQAMAAGICCITTNCCGQRDIIDHGKSGLLFEPGDYFQLADYIERCVMDDEFRDGLGAMAKKQTESWTWENVSEEVVNFVCNNI